MSHAVRWLVGGLAVLGLSVGALVVIYRFGLPIVQTAPGSDNRMALATAIAAAVGGALAVALAGIWAGGVAHAQADGSVTRRRTSGEAKHPDESGSGSQTPELYPAAVRTVSTTAASVRPAETAHRSVAVTRTAPLPVQDPRSAEPLAASGDPLQRYARSLESLRSRHGLDGCFMDLAGEQLLPTRRYIQSTVSWIVDEAGREQDRPGHDASTRQSLRAFVLGNYGSGKSSVAIEAAHRALQRRIETGAGRLPIYLSLREWRSLPSWEDIVRRVVDGGVHPFSSRAELEEMSARDEVFFLLDGLDEIAAHLTSHEPIALVNEIPRSLNDAPFVTFSRLSLFEEYDGVFDLVNESTHLLPADLAAWLGASQYQAIRLVEPTQRQIRSYLEAVCGPDAGFATSVLRDIYNLADLARRPVLLMMIAKCIPVLRDRVASGLPLRPGDLYELYVAQWQEHERDRARLSERDRRTILDELAIYMWRDQVLRIPHARLEEFVRTRFGDGKLAAFLHDIRNCSFLDLVADGFEFSHKSFLEYFVASAITTDLFAHNRDAELRLSACLRHAVSESEVTDFVQDQVLSRLMSGVVRISPLLALLESASAEDRGRVGHVLGHIASKVATNGRAQLATEIRGRLEEAVRRETDDWALRSLAIACGRAGNDEESGRYVTQLLPMPQHRYENLRYHLQYYGGIRRTLVMVVLHLLADDHDFLRGVDLFTLQQIIDGESPMTDDDRRIAREQLGDLTHVVSGDHRGISAQEKLFSAVREGGRTIVEEISGEGLAV